MEMLAKNGNVGQKWKCWTKMEMLAKNGNVGQKWKCWPKMEMLAKNPNLGKNRIVPEVRAIIANALVRNRNFSQKSKFSPNLLHNTVIRIDTRKFRDLKI